MENPFKKILLVSLLLVNFHSSYAAKTGGQPSPQHEWLHLFSADPCIKNADETYRLKRDQFALSLFNRAIDDYNEYLGSFAGPLNYLQVEDLSSKEKLIHFFQETLVNFTLKSGIPMPKMIRFIPTYISNSLDNGILPVPVSSSWGDENLFGFSGIFQSMRLGLLPVSLEFNPRRPIALGNEHPLNPDLVNSSSSLFYHDFLHVDLMSQIYLDLNLGQVESCHAFTECIQSIPDLYQNPKTRIGLSYALHEDLSFFTTLKRPQSFYYDFALLDFAFELTLGVKSFSVETLVGSQNSREVCHALLNSPEAELLSSLKAMIPSELQAGGFYEGIFISEKTAKSLVPRFLLKLQNACRAISGESLALEEPGNLNLGIDTEKFKERFKGKLRDLYDSLVSLKGYIEDPRNAACRQMLRR